MIQRRSFMALPFSSILIGGCDARPKEVGVFIKTSEGWKKPLFFDWEPWLGGYSGTEKLSRESLTKVSTEVNIYIQGIPLDPQALFWGRNAKTRKDSRLELTLDSQPTSVSVVKEGAYEVKPEKLPPGINALVQKGGVYSYRAYFFEVVA